jgi:hypothetical protein
MNAINKSITEIIRFLQGNTNLNNTNSNTQALYDDGAYETDLEDKDIHQDYLWLLILDLLIFIGLTFTSYSSSKKMMATNTNPDDFRPKFIKGLIYANGSTYIILIIKLEHSL